MNKNFLMRTFLIIFTGLIITISLVSSSYSILALSNTNFEKHYVPIQIDWWPMFHHDANQNGFSRSLAPETNDVLWTYQTDNLISSSPSVLDGKVYIGSMDKKFYCFDMMNGSVLWNFSTKGKIKSSSAVENGKVFFGSQDSTFYCLNADNGSKIWDFDTNHMIESSPTVKNDKVFFSGSNGTLYCLNADDGSLIWDYSVGNAIWTSPAVNDDKLYFGSLSGDFYCLDVYNGNFIWSYSTPGDIWSSPALYDDKIYFGSNDNYVYCLNADNGSLIWKYDTGGEIHSSPAIAYGNVYIGSIGRGLFCLNAETGDLVWKFLINNGIWSSPSVADNKIYYGNDPCCGTPSYLYCNNAFTGEIIWQYNLGGDIGTKSTPAIAAGKVFISDSYGKVFALGGNELYADANGPYNGIINKTIQFKGKGYGGKPNYAWFWDFGDGESSYKQNPTHSYTSIGEYTITLTITDEDNNIAIDVTSATIIKDNNSPPNVPIIEGPLNGKIGEEHTYCISNIFDADGDNIFVFWDWGDGKNSDWLGPYINGEQVCEKHIWYKRGNSTIKVKLKDEFGLESDWGYLEVNMPRNNIGPDLLFKRLVEQLLNINSILRQLLNL